MPRAVDGLEKDEDLKEWVPDEEDYESNKEDEADTKISWSVSEMLSANAKLGVKSSYIGIQQYSNTIPEGDAEARRKADIIAKEIERNEESQRNAMMENFDEERDVVISEQKKFEFNVTAKEFVPKHSELTAKQNSMFVFQQVPIFNAPPDLPQYIPMVQPHGYSAQPLPVFNTQLGYHSIPQVQPIQYMYPPVTPVFNMQHGYHFIPHVQPIQYIPQMSHADNVRNISSYK